MSNRPTGTVTFLFTDIEGSTKLAREYAEQWEPLYERHNAVLHSAVENHNGFIFRIVGDSFAVAFHTADDALNAALQAQRELQHEAWPSAPVKVRMGINTGSAQLKQDSNGTTYEGYATLALTQRIMSAGHGGQILLSKTTYDLVKDSPPDGIELRDVGDHKLKDILHLERLHQVVASDLPSDFAPLKTLETARHNIPPQLTSFVGRERELKEAAEKLASARLLTLIGPGGTGKTRLSIQLATEMFPHFADGVWFIELAPLADPVLILQSVASVLGVRAQAGMLLTTIVNDYLRAKNLLLILDNCEHLIEASAELADEILHNAPQVKIIVSSREALGIGGEMVYRVPSLSLPSADAAGAGGAGRISRFESVQLFVERASAANPKFHLTDENASHIAQICSRLDGIPLALELAASRVSAFTPEQIARRLDDRFKLLTGGSRTALPRQQTLRALIDWSYDILSPVECTLLKRLSVFAGGWIFEAAESMFADMDVLGLLPQLVNKSLVVMDEEGDEPRYRLLETIRQYARDKLLESGEAAEIRNRHLAYHVQFTENAEQQLLGSTALKWVNRLEAEYDNLRTAIEWGMDNNVMAVLRMAGALPNFWFRRGYEGEGIKWIHEALERVKSLPEVEGDPSTSSGARERLAIIAKSWQSVSLMSFSQGDMLNASAAAATCAGYARQLGDKRLLATVLTFEAASKMMSGHFKEVDGIMQEVLSIVDESNDPFAIGMAYGMLGSRMIMAGRDNEESRALVEKGLAALKGNENRFGHTMVLFATAMGARFNGRFEEARTQFAPLVPIFHDMGDSHRSNMVRSEMAHMERLEGHYDIAAALYRETILEWKRLGHRAAVANQFECFAFIAKAHEQPERAIKLLGAAEALREKINIHMTELERVEYEREASDLKANMDEKVFAALWAEGRSMTMEQAIEMVTKE